MDTDNHTWANYFLAAYKARAAAADAMSTTQPASICDRPGCAGRVRVPGLQGAPARGPGGDGVRHRPRGCAHAPTSVLRSWQGSQAWLPCCIRLPRRWGRRRRPGWGAAAGACTALTRGVRAGSGLSSSAAIVCSSALAVLRTLGQRASQTVCTPWQGRPAETAHWPGGGAQGQHSRFCACHCILRDLLGM